MNDLLIAAIPFVAFMVLLVAWLSQNRKASVVRTAKPTRKVREAVTATTLTSSTATVAEANRSTQQQLA